MRTRTCATVALGLAAVVAIGSTTWASNTTPARSKAEHCAVEMSEERFWKLIDTASHGDDEARIVALRASLGNLSLDELIAFELAFGTQFVAAYSWDIWGAAYVANGGASDDGFAYFRYWLISRGRRSFQLVVDEPDNLADIVPADAVTVLELEEFGSVAVDLWVRKSGKDYEDLHSELAKFADCRPATTGPSGTPFRDDPATLARRYPKLWRRFGENPLG